MRRRVGVRVPHGDKKGTTPLGALVRPPPNPFAARARPPTGAMQDKNTAKTEIALHPQQPQRFSAKSPVGRLQLPQLMQSEYLPHFLDGRPPHPREIGRRAQVEGTLRYASPRCAQAC